MFGPQIRLLLSLADPSDLWSVLFSQIQYETRVDECWSIVKQASPAPPPSAWRTWWKGSGCVWTKRSSLCAAAAASSRPTSASWANCCSSSPRSLPPPVLPKLLPRRVHCSDPSPRWPTAPRPSRQRLRSSSTSPCPWWIRPTCTTARSRPPPAANGQPSLTLTLTQTESLTRARRALGPTDL